MFFAKVESINIDGTLYEISNGAMVDTWNCKESLVEIFEYLDPSRVEPECNSETYVSWKKELMKMLKEWDKVYNKHMKSVYPEMNKIHMDAMKPLTDLISANLNFHNLELMEKDKKEVPEFRRIALEEQFCKHLTNVCQIFKEYGDLKDHFHIKQMMSVLKIHNWRNITPFAYYLNPLNNAINVVRKTLIKMHEDGHLLIKYIIE